LKAGFRKGLQRSMRLTKQTGHAIRILCDCAAAGDRLVKVADLAERLDITKANVFKIVHILSRHGFVAAVRGPHGGVRLAKAAHLVRIGDVVRAIEETASQLSDTRSGRSTPVPLSSVFDNAFDAFISVLDQHTLADLAATPLLSAGEKRRGAKGSSTKAAAEGLRDRLKSAGSRRG
jgi:Rrf2 family protein